MRTKINLRAFKPKMPDLQMPELYGHMVSEIAMLQDRNGYKVFAVSNCSHNAGAFEVAKELAVRFADMGKKTLMINGDLYGPKDGSISGIDLSKRKGFSDFLMEKQELRPKDILADPYRNKPFSIIGRGTNTSTQKEFLLCSPKIQILLSTFCDQYDIMFFVTPSLLAPVSGKMLCKVSDAVIFVAAMGQTKKEQLESAKKQIDELEVPVAGIVATRSKKTALEQYFDRFDRQSMK